MTLQVYWLFLFDMDKEEINDYLAVEFNVPDPSHLDREDRITAFERLKFSLKMQNVSADEYSKGIITLIDHLQI